MPRFQQAMDLHRNRYMDPNYLPHFEAEDIARREARTRSVVWSWYDWGVDKVLYWNVVKEAELPRTPEEVKMRRIEARIKQEQVQNRLFQEKRQALGSQLRNWYHLNQTILEQNDYLRRSKTEAKEEMRALRKLLRFRDMDRFRHQRMLEREKIYLDQKKEASVTIVTDTESRSETDSMCILPVLPQARASHRSVVNTYEPAGALQETPSTGTLRTEPSWRDKVGQILPNMTSTVKDLIRQTNKACKRIQFEEVQEDRPPVVTASSIERIFDVDNKRFPKRCGVPLSLSIPVLDQSGYEVLMDQDGYVLTDQDDLIPLDTKSDHLESNRHEWLKSRNLVETESSPSLVKVAQPILTSFNSNKTNSVVDENGNAKDSLTSLGSSVIIMDAQGYEVLGAEREAYKAELRGEPRAVAPSEGLDAETNDGEPKFEYYFNYSTIFANPPATNWEPIHMYNAHNAVADEVNERAPTIEKSRDLT